MMLTSAYPCVICWQKVSSGSPPGDEVCGRSSKLRAACEGAGNGYVFVVPVNFTVNTPAAARRPRQVPRDGTCGQS